MEAIVIYIGIPEVQHDDKTTCDQLVGNFFIETMSVKKEDVDAMRFVRVIVSESHSHKCKTKIPHPLAP